MILRIRPVYVELHCLLSYTLIEGTFHSADFSSSLASSPHVVILSFHRRVDDFIMTYLGPFKKIKWRSKLLNQFFVFFCDIEYRLEK